MTKPTNGEVMRQGTSIDDWPCDVGADGSMESNGSVEHIVEYEGRLYSVICDYNSNPRWPRKPASPTSPDD